MRDRFHKYLKMHLDHNLLLGIFDETFFLWFDSPCGPRSLPCRCFEVTLRHTTLGRTPLG